ncbi:Plexin-B1 [Manis pentadactyla]|nr:Plexin-B1 [Manis pentadactyla]
MDIEEGKGLVQEQRILLKDIGRTKVVKTSQKEYSCSPATDRRSARRQQAPAAGTLNATPQQGISRRQRSQAGVRSKDHAPPIVSFRAPKPEKPRIPGPS